jgi:hypothetical protein
VSPREPPGAGDDLPHSEPLPEAVRELIVRRIDSVADLEALLLLRNEPQQRWDANAVARRLYIDEARAAATLQRLVQRGLAAPQDGGWRYAAETPALADAVQALCDIYSQRLVAMTALIHGKTARGIEEFARAFVIRRKE